MKTYTEAELNEILQNHKHWVCEDITGWKNMRANLRGADLRGADLRGADLREADLRGADLREAANIPFIPMACPDTGVFSAWKKANGYIVKLEIPADARRSSASGRKCRCDKAKVIEIQKTDGSPSELKKVESNHDRNFVYRVGEIAKEPEYDEDRWNECAPGIHFFINRQEAVDYDG